MQSFNLKYAVKSYVTKIIPWILIKFKTKIAVYYSVIVQTTMF